MHVLWTVWTCPAPNGADDRRLSNGDLPPAAAAVTSVSFGRHVRGRPHLRASTPGRVTLAAAAPPGCQVLLLVHLRRNETFAGLAAVFGVGVANAHREVTEVWTCWPSCRLTL